MKKLEIWKDIPDYEGLYQASNMGNIRSIARKHTKGGILRYSMGSGGYKQLVLCKNGKPRTYMIHRLIAKTFLTNDNNLKEINHKDENKLNNCLENLEYCDRIYNQNYGTAIIRMVKNHNYKESIIKSAAHRDYNLIAQKTRKKILQLDLNDNIIKEWDGIRVASKQLSLSVSNISKCCNNKAKTCGNYRWKFA